MLRRSFSYALLVVLGVAGCSLTAPSEDELLPFMPEPLDAGNRHEGGPDGFGTAGGAMTDASSDAQVWPGIGGFAGAAGGGGVPGTGAAPGSGATGGQGGTSGAGGLGGSGGAPGCALVTLPSATPQPARLLVALEDDAALAGTSEWSGLTLAFDSYLAAPIIQQTEMALVPIAGTSWCQQPALQVAMGPVPLNEAAISAAVAATPSGFKWGLIGTVKAFPSFCNGPRCVGVILGTSSTTEFCSSSYSATFGAVPFPVYYLNIFGSTPPKGANYAEEGTAPTVQSSAHLNELLQHIAACRYAMPADADPSTLHVSLVKSAGQPGVTLTRVSSVAACLESGESYVVDSGGISLCKKTCEQLSSGWLKLSYCPTSAAK